MNAILEKITYSDSALFQTGEYILPQFNAPWHFHPELELTYIVKSEGVRLVGDSVERFRAGDLVLLGSNLPHRWVNQTTEKKQKAHSIVIQFSSNIFSDIWMNSSDFSPIRNLFEKSKRGIHFSLPNDHSVFKEILNICKKEKTDKILSFLSILSQLSKVKEMSYLTSSVYLKPEDLETYIPVQKAYQYIMDNFQESFVLTDVAEFSGTTPSSLCRLFKKCSKKTLFTFVNEVRIHNACMKLIDTSMSITEIGYSCGFNSLSSFQKAFQKFASVSPREYRKKHKA
jgi:AraC-like DNA-binding protein